MFLHTIVRFHDVRLARSARTTDCAVFGGRVRSRLTSDLNLIPRLGFRYLLVLFPRSGNGTQHSASFFLFQTRRRRNLPLRSTPLSYILCCRIEKSGYKTDILDTPVSAETFIGWSLIGSFCHSMQPRW